MMPIIENEAITKELGKCSGAVRKTLSRSKDAVRKFSHILTFPNNLKCFCGHLKTRPPVYCKKKIM